jgi:hypothetical protein
MTLIPETINNRKILYLDIKDNLNELANADFTNWVLFVIEDDATNPILWSFAELCIDKDLLYMTAVGKACSKIDDLFDEVMNVKEFQGRQLPSWMKSSEDVLMTSWDHNFNEGFWFITTVANYEGLLIDTVVVANLTPNDHCPIIRELTEKINKGWLPSD